MKKLIFPLVLLSLITLQVHATSSVWKAEKDGSAIYLGGTIHLLRASDFPLPPEFDTAYAAADTLVFEADITAMQKMETQQKLMMAARYSDGTTLEDHLSPETFQELASLYETNGIPTIFLKQLKPAMAVLMITMNELMEIGITTEGVDSRFHKKALTDGKQLVYLETVDQQIELLLSMGMDDPDAFVSYSLQDLTTMTHDFMLMINAWKIGDSLGLEHFTLESLQAMPTLYDEMIVSRNRAWIEKIPTWQQTPETELVLVGAAHLVGPDGILSFLENNGWDVTQLNVPTEE